MGSDSKKSLGSDSEKKLESDPIRGVLVLRAVVRQACALRLLHGDDHAGHEVDSSEDVRWRCFPRNFPKQALLGSIDEAVIVEGGVDFACSEPAADAGPADAATMTSSATIALRRAKLDATDMGWVSWRAVVVRASVFLARLYFCSAQDSPTPAMPI